MPVSDQTIIAKIANLKTLDSKGLKKMWLELYEAEPPSFNRQYLERRLAYRIQELAFGGLSRDTRERLNMLIENPSSHKPMFRSSFLTAGTMLQRKWNGQDHRVTVLQDGFEYNGKRYRSLSPIAREITGTNWNGPMFFGLRGKRRL